MKYKSYKHIKDGIKILVEDGYTVSDIGLIDSDWEEDDYDE
jgi:hypothetical protein